MTDRYIIDTPLGTGAFTPDELQRGLERFGRIAEGMPQAKTTTTDDDKPLWLTVPQVSKLCNVSETHLRDEIALGNIKTRRFRRAVRIHRDFVEHQTLDLVSHANGDE